MTACTRRGALHLIGAAAAIGVAGRAGAAGERRVVCWGDSLTAGGATQSYPLELGRLLGREVLNRGVGGQKSTQIAMRAGALPIALRIDGGRIAAGENRIIAINGHPLAGHAVSRDPDDRFLSTPSRPDPIVARGRLAGVTGTLTGRGVGDGKPAADIRYTFVPDALAGPVTCADDTPFMVETGMARTDTVVIWAGRNNYADGATVLADIAAMVRALPTRHVLILSVPNGNYPGESTGGAKWAQIWDLNRQLARAYRGRFLDVRAMLVAEGAPGGRFASVEDFARDVPPRTLRADNIHLNPDGQRIVAAAVAAGLRRRGW